MPSSEMLRLVALVRTDVSDQLSASIIRVTRIGELGTTLVVTSNRGAHIFLRSVHRLLVTTNVVPMKNGGFWDVMPCGSCKNRRFGGT
jgi:hypothetical protein